MEFCIFFKRHEAMLENVWWWVGKPLLYAKSKTATILKKAVGVVQIQSCAEKIGICCCRLHPNFSQNEMK